MKLLLLVCIGGAVGSGLRYGTDQLLLRQWPEQARAFPWATLTVNLAGCLLAGLLYGYALREGVRFGEEIRLLMITGLCGGLTTFSAFALQTMQANPTKAVANVSASVVGGLVLAWLGLWLTSPSNA